jgi:Tfp pilus assembly protein PilV
MEFEYIAGLINKLKFRSNQKGITIPETLIALAIFALVAVTFTAALGTNFKMLLVADQRTTAESLAKAQLEAINNAPYDAVPPLTYDKITGIPYGYDVNITVELINPETGAVSATDLGVQKVTCTVTCQGYSPSNAPVFTIEAYKR